ncbi:hypothetical protein DSM106972_097190 [Dulcicalothrix desertica PCC 7102]|uniref:DNA helicase n=1 Tax=Dulcicalothrix desertica PCC 7102 TaxID=232991 RepID=A0A433UH23_9CYAN|nr:AAA domain-containing protein [Dulcicalothrix desertica]RUS93125.1 hypothetical protein DSM106972_097190 [Dulcicalothrix desertica PCC 7102]TWH62777.1 DNA replication ATP-dependent helicase Dna2 [Dulcicalothrix desertica PCC 7102]
MAPYPITIIPKKILTNHQNITESLNSPTMNPQEDTFFWYYLEKYFPLQVKRGYSFGSYTPDFIYTDPVTGTYIDIELDEPYVYGKEEPTHFQGYDDKRNQLFINNGWAIIRFSEEQIVRYPDSCCKELAELITYLRTDESILEDFLNIPNLPPSPHWSYSEALNMAQNNYRDTYLSIDSNISSILKNIDNGQFIDTLKRFINVEVDTETRKTKERWQKPIHERVQEGYSIDKVEVIEVSGTKAWLRFSENISKFDKSDNLILSRGNPTDKEKFKCTIIEENDSEFLVGAAYGQSFDNLYPSEGWVLDAGIIDVRHLLIGALTKLANNPTKREQILGILNGAIKPSFNAKNLTSSQYLVDSNALPKQKEAFQRAFATDNYYLIQGPPGTGKTWLLAQIAVSLARLGQRVLITAFTHSAINNALQKIVQVTGYNKVIKIGAYDKTEGLSWNGDNVPNYEKFIRVPKELDTEGLIIGSTCYATCTKALENVNFDTVIFDESGQVTLPVAVVGMMAGKRYIFIGDHKQMPPVIVGRHGEQWVTRSVFETLFNHAPGTMLDVTHRMNAEINDFPSQCFYDGKLNPSPIAKQRCLQLKMAPTQHVDILDPAKPNIFVEVHHQNRGMRSPEEAKLIGAIVHEALVCGIKASEIAVVVPYRAQARLIRQQLQKTASEYGIAVLTSVLVDTVESMQGQERDIIIASLTTSDPIHAAQRAEFYFQLNRLNVAITRSRVKRIVVGSPIIFETEPKQKEHRSWVQCFKNFYLQSTILTHSL